MSYTGEERLTIWLKRIHAMNEFRHEQIRERHPDADDARVRRLWVEQTYPGEFTEEYLDGYEELVRRADTIPRP
jgi:hypothetical protein